MPEIEERKVVDHTTHRTVDMRKCISKSHETFNNLKANFRQEVENQTNFYQRQKTGVVVKKKSRTEYFSKAFKAHTTRKQKAIKILYDLFDPMDFRNKDSFHEHHDLIVGKGYLEII
jgi:hypothetical protein